MHLKTMEEWVLHRTSMVHLVNDIPLVSMAKIRTDQQFGPTDQFTSFHFQYTKTSLTKVKQ